MAALKLQMTLQASSCLFFNSIQKQTHFLPCAITQLQFVRGSRRTCRPKPHWAKKKASSIHAQKHDLTLDNQAFLKEVAEDQYSKELQSPLKEEPWPRNTFDQWRTRRTGVLGVKIGVIPQWTKEGHKFFVTVLQVLDNHVIRYVPPEEFKTQKGYRKRWRGTHASCVVGAMSSDPFSYAKSYVNLFKEAGVPPKRKLTRFLITPDAAVQPGTPLYATHFKVGDYVDCQAKTIGHGFQGVVKRWGFKGGPASHGNTKWHRRPGTLSSGRTMARVMKGQKLPGHMGMEIRTLRGLKIFRINTKYQLLFVKGPCLPGPNHCYVRIMDTILPLRKMVREEPIPMPTWYKDDVDEPLPEDIFDPELFQLDQPTIMFEDKASPTQKKKNKHKA